MTRRLPLRSEWALALCCLALYLATAARVGDGRRSALAIAVVAVTTPLLDATNFVAGLVSDAVAGRTDLRRLLAEHAALRAEVAELRRTNQLIASELAVLRQASALVDGLAGATDRVVIARVVGRDVLGTSTLHIDRGSRDGVLADAPVLGERGVLGRVAVVTARASRVQLLTHPAAAAAARILGIEGEALVVGGEAPHLSGLPPYTEVASGLPVVTSGSEGIYPPGLLLGTTGEAETRGLFTVVALTLAARPVEATTVLVIPPLTARP